MQVTIDIPEALYRELEDEAHSKGLSVAETAAERLSPAAGESRSTKRRITFPLVHATERGTLDLTQNLNDLWLDESDAA